MTRARLQSFDCSNLHFCYFTELNKHEEVGSILDVPESFLRGHPFPRPGFAVCVLGDVTEGNALEVLRQVDEIFVQAIKDEDMYDTIWQAFVVFLPVQTVGIQGDQRTHSHAVIFREIASEDGMTADWGAAAASSTGGRGEAARPLAWATLKWRRRRFLVSGGAPVTRSSGGEWRTTTAEQTSKQSRGEKASGGTEDQSEAVEWLGEA